MFSLGLPSLFILNIVVIIANFIRLSVVLVVIMDILVNVLFKVLVNVCLLFQMLVYLVIVVLLRQVFGLMGVFSLDFLLSPVLALDSFFLLVMDGVVKHELVILLLVLAVFLLMDLLLQSLLRGHDGQEEEEKGLVYLHDYNYRDIQAPYNRWRPTLCW